MSSLLPLWLGHDHRCTMEGNHHTLHSPWHYCWLSGLTNLAWFQTRNILIRRRRLTISRRSTAFCSTRNLAPKIRASSSAAQPLAPPHETPGKRRLACREEIHAGAISPHIEVVGEQPLLLETQLCQIVSSIIPKQDPTAWLEHLSVVAACCPLLDGSTCGWLNLKAVLNSLSPCIRMKGGKDEHEDNDIHRLRLHLCGYIL